MFMVCYRTNGLCDARNASYRLFFFCVLRGQVVWLTFEYIPYSNYSPRHWRIAETKHMTDGGMSIGWFITWQLFSWNPHWAKYVNIVDHFNYIMMVRDVCILNESWGKLEVMEKKEHKPGDFRVGRSVDDDHIIHIWYMWFVYMFYIVICCVRI